MPEIEFHPDLKQQQNESQAREDLQRLRRRGVEYGVEGARRDPTEERGSEQDADDDFADGGGLAAALPGGCRRATAPSCADPRLTAGSCGQAKPPLMEMICPVM
jgi:hypothetical protein